MWHRNQTTTEANRGHLNRPGRQDKAYRNVELETVCRVERVSKIDGTAQRSDNDVVTDVEGTKGTTTVDASASYKIDDHWEVSFEALNLTDEFNDQWVDSIGDRASVYHHTGRQYMLGVRFKY